MLGFQQILLIPFLFLILSILQFLKANECINMLKIMSVDAFDVLWEIKLFSKPYVFTFRTLHKENNINILFYFILLLFGLPMLNRDPYLVSPSI